MKKLKTIPLAYQLPVSAVLGYYLVLAILLGLLLSRTGSFWGTLPFVVMHTWGQHISNFALSSMFYSGIGLVWILQGAPRKVYIWLAAILIILNFGIEQFVSVLNTPDIVDAYFGTAGVLLGIVAIWLLQKTKLQTHT